MEYPLSTGEAARALDLTEPRLAEFVRRGKISPEPRIVAGRRLWEREHLIQAARAMGILDNDCLARIRGEEGAGPVS